MSTTTSDVAHYDGQEFWGPYDAVRIDRLLEMLAPAPGASVLDIGCGKAELLLRLADRYGCRVTGVDMSPHALALARAAFTERCPDADVTLLELDVKKQSVPEGPYDLIVWLGGSFIGEQFAETLQALTALLRPGGQLLIGHGFWMQTPPPEYVEATGISTDWLTDHAGNIACGQACGLRITHSSVSTRDEWDTFEGMIQHHSERYALENPDAPDPQGRLEQRRVFFDAQQRWGRETMGFGFYLFSKPLATEAGPGLLGDREA
ncbi:MAG: SAM-dependent methyltransferase [Planctomycetota bacterium]|jgi:SAM-dependent methyltransferase